MITTNTVCHVQQAKAEEACTDPALVAELQREVEDLKLRLHMAAEHYKEKYKECTRLQKQVLKLSEQPGVSRHSVYWQDSLCLSHPRAFFMYFFSFVFRVNFQ